MYETVHPSDLDRISRVFMSSIPIATFDFDIFHFVLAILYNDPILTLWDIPDPIPF